MIQAALVGQTFGFLSGVYLALINLMPFLTIYSLADFKTSCYCRGLSWLNYCCRFRGTKLRSSKANVFHIVGKEMSNV